LSAKLKITSVKYLPPPDAHNTSISSEGTENRQQAIGNRKQGTENREQAIGNRKNSEINAPCPMPHAPE
jgi:hypothetical protein